MSQFVIAFDLSLTATGVAWKSRHDGEIYRETIAPGALSGMERLNKIATKVFELIDLYSPSLVVFEGPSYGSNDPSAQERAGLAYIIRYEIWRRGLQFLLVPPSTLKKFVTGKGNAEKSLVLKEVYKRWSIDAANDNEADAVVLAYIGLAYTGQWEPTTDAQREVIEMLKGGTPKKTKKRVAGAGKGK